MRGTEGRRVGLGRHPKGAEESSQAWNAMQMFAKLEFETEFSRGEVREWLKRAASKAAIP